MAVTNARMCVERRVCRKDLSGTRPPFSLSVSRVDFKLMTSLTSKDLVSCRFSWKHYYWFLNDEGIEWLREYLHLPEDMIPNTLKKPITSAPRPPSSGGDRPGKGDGPPRGGKGDGREGYRSEGGGERRGFGRGAPRPPA